MKHTDTLDADAIRAIVNTANRVCEHENPIDTPCADCAASDGTTWGHIPRCWRCGVSPCECE